MSSSRPRNGEQNVAPHLATIRAWIGWKQSVRFVLVPSAVEILRALTPSGIVGSLTVMFFAGLERGRASLSISSQVTETTSAETGPGMTSQISRRRVLKSLPSLATRLGLV